MRINYEKMGYNNNNNSEVQVAPTPATIEPVSRTYQYRKVMKPMLERKRRARINRCLDELKELMVTALQSEGENVSKLEKADILELTVKHLHKLRHQKRLSSANPVVDADRFRAGFTHAATEVSRCLASTPGVDIQLGTKLMTHLGHRLNELDKVQPLSIQVTCAQQNIYSPPISPISTSSRLSNSSSNCGDFQQTYQLPLTPASSMRSTVITPTSSPNPIEMIHQQQNQHFHHHIQQTHGLLKVVQMNEKVWRPW